MIEKESGAKVAPKAGMPMPSKDGKRPPEPPKGKDGKPLPPPDGKRYVPNGENKKK